MDKHTKKHSSAVDGVVDQKFNFEQWLGAYRAESSVDGRISLLHNGADVVPFEFYLQEADGHAEIFADNRFLSEDELNDLGILHPETAGQLASQRQRIAKKAFDMLVALYFKDQRRSDSDPVEQWIGKLSTKLDALVQFFRLDEDQKFVNLGHRVPDHLYKVVTDFLLELTRHGWEPFTNTHRDTRELEKLLAGYRIPFISILCGLGKLDLLLRWISHSGQTTGEAELQKLTELALSKELYFSEAVWHPSGHRHYRPETIEQAAYAGSQAGQVAILLRERLKVRKHFEEVAAAWRERQAAERKLQELSGR